MLNKLETFLVCITIIEGRHYAWTNMDSYVAVKVNKQKRYTPVKKSTDSPFYNEYFVFEFTTTFSKFLDYNIKITVIQPGKFSRKKKSLGYFTLDAATVWSQSDHQFYNKWAVLSSPPNDDVEGTRGYLKVNIAILSKGEVPKIPTEPKNTDEIEGNLLLPEGITMQRQRAKFIFDVYRAENLISKDEDAVNRSVFDERKQTESKIDSFIEIHFAGNTVKTTVKKNSANPVWNERLVIVEPFPPLCQRFDIRLYIEKDCSKRYINLQSISSDKENGFLPTYGPSYLHFYTCGDVDGYIGSVLLEINTTLLDLIPTNTNATKPQSPNRKSEQLIFTSDNIYLFCGLFHMAVINRKYTSKPISLKLTLGQYNAHPKTDNPEELANVSSPKAPKRTNKVYWHLSFDENKPCMYLCSLMPSFRRRMYNSNMLQKISGGLKMRLAEIQNIFDQKELQDRSQEIENQLLGAIDYLESSAMKYIDLLSTYGEEEGNKLDKERIRLCRSEIAAIREQIKTIYNPRSKRNSYKRLQKICTKIEGLTNEPQDTLPDIYIWMYSGKSKVAYYKIPARTLIYSNIEEEKGIQCGEIHDLFLEPTGTQVLTQAQTHVPLEFACKVRLLLWLGFQRQIPSCFETAPSGFSFEKPKGILPDAMRIDEKHVFQCRAHIFQGRFIPGSDKSGLCDPYVQIVFGTLSKQTQVIQSTLNPIWDQTLIFPNLNVNGSKEFIRAHPYTIFVEVLDQDECYRSELVGRAIAYPVIKFIDESYSAPDFPPKLQWYKVYNKSEETAEILAVFEFLEISRDPNEINDVEADDGVIEIPNDIKPQLVDFRIEIVFWGMRQLKKVQMNHVNKPRITVLCVGQQLHSETISDSKTHPNFTNYIKSMDVVMPIQEAYIPPIILKLFDSRSFGVHVYAGTHITNVAHCMFYPLTHSKRLHKLYTVPEFSKFSLISKSSSVVINIEIVSKGSVDSKLKDTKAQELSLKHGFLKSLCFKFSVRKNKKLPIKKTESVLSSIVAEGDTEDDSDFDWWTKFYASLEAPDLADKQTTIGYKSKLKIYPNELEHQPEFSGFCDIINTFPLYKGKRTGDESWDEENITGVFKGSLKIYRWPLEDEASYVTDSGLPLADGVFQDFPSNEPLRYLLRVYCVRAIGLTPKDLNGKSDPYLVVTLNDKVINDRENRIMRQLNPTFGRCFEFSATFPLDNMLSIAIWDWDMTTQDDLVGETKIDVENRFFTHHRACCGLPDTYQETGYCEWRDQYKPTVILDSLCRRWNLEDPEYTETSVLIGSKQFQLKPTKPNTQSDPQSDPRGKAQIAMKEGTEPCRHCQVNMQGDTGLNPESASCETGIDDAGDAPVIVENPEVDPLHKEVLALATLNHWNEMPLVGRFLVPEHVETRSLYNPRKPGIEQGKLQLWIDIFAYTDLPPPKQVNIAPRKPIDYELRVIIWNTEEVELNEDDYFAGERKSDIYVKGWLTSPEEAQYTDVHYRSLTGEGNFNWRFVFRFQYLTTENKLVLKKKDGVFALSETEYKIACTLTLQVWDNDTFSADDFLGTLSIELCRMARGAPSADKCKLYTNPKTINLFKIKRTKGWWAFTNKNKTTGNVSIGGKVEAELELVLADEAVSNPVGKGRDDPRGLPKPNRPDTSFSWFKNPLKALKYLLCKKFKKRCLAALILLLLGTMVVGGLEAVPGYSVKKILHV